MKLKLSYAFRYQVVRQIKISVSNRARPIIGIIGIGIGISVFFRKSVSVRLKVPEIG